MAKFAISSIALKRPVGPTDILEKAYIGVREDNAPTLVGANHREAVMRISQHAPRRV